MACDLFFESICPRHYFEAWRSTNSGWFCKIFFKHVSTHTVPTSARATKMRPYHVFVCMLKKKTSEIHRTLYCATKKMVFLLWEKKHGNAQTIHQSLRNQRQTLRTKRIAHEIGCLILRLSGACEFFFSVSFLYIILFLCLSLIIFVTRQYSWWLAVIS